MDRKGSTQLPRKGPIGHHLFITYLAELHELIYVVLAQHSLGYAELSIGNRDTLIDTEVLIINVGPVVIRSEGGYAK